MDIFSHALWGNLEFRVVPQTKDHPHLIGWGIFFSIFPDLFAFSYAFVWIFWHRFFKRTIPQWPRTPEEYQALPLADLTYTLYQWSHSIVVWLAVFIGTWFITRDIPWILLGWLTHILIDIPTHDVNFYPTPYLWPIPHRYVNGYPWADPKIMGLNAVLLIFGYVLFL